MRFIYVYHCRLIEDEVLSYHEAVEFVRLKAAMLKQDDEVRVMRFCLLFRSYR